MLTSTTSYIALDVIPAAWSLLPETLTTPPAKALLLAIGLQESRFAHRAQVNGPARGWWQFEGGPLSGCAQVLQHPACRNNLHGALTILQYPVTLTPMKLRNLIEHNDVLAAVCARLLLVPDPAALPAEGMPEPAWDYYVRCWHPGKPHRETWDAFYAESWRWVTE